MIENAKVEEEIGEGSDPGAMRAARSNSVKRRSTWRNTPSIICYWRTLIYGRV